MKKIQASEEASNVNIHLCLSAQFIESVYNNTPQPEINKALVQAISHLRNNPKEGTCQIIVCWDKYKKASHINDYIHNLLEKLEKPAEKFQVQMNRIDGANGIINIELHYMM